MGMTDGEKLIEKYILGIEAKDIQIKKSFEDLRVLMKDLMKEEEPGYKAQETYKSDINAEGTEINKRFNESSNEIRELMRDLEGDIHVAAHRSYDAAQERALNTSAGSVPNPNYIAENVYKYISSRTVTQEVTKQGLLKVIQDCYERK